MLFFIMNLDEPLDQLDAIRVLFCYLLYFLYSDKWSKFLKETKYFNS
jgi:hypothetical protein